MLDETQSSVTSAISQEVEKELFSHFFIKFLRSIRGFVAVIYSKLFYSSHLMIVDLPNCKSSYLFLKYR